MVCCAAALSFGTASIAFAETGSAGAQVQQLTDNVNTDAAAETAETAGENMENTQAGAEETAGEYAQGETETAEEEAAGNAQETGEEAEDLQGEAMNTIRDAGLPALTGDTAYLAETAPEQDPITQELRQEVVEYALSFVGGRYVWGGEDPHSGADCSGFVRYILSNTAGVSMSRSSYDQAREGETVSPEEMQPGDLLFYGNGRRVNHVAMYIGNGQIVHASTAKTGIKVSRWNYRTPVRIASFIG